MNIKKVCCTGIVLIVALQWLACSRPQNGERGNRLFEKKENTGIQFENTVKNSKDFNIFSYRNFYNGGGVAIGDVNNDSLPDIYFTANQGANKLYLNKGNWQFEDITEKAGVASANKWSTGVVMVDVNADGLLDIYVCNAGFQEGMAQDNQLYLNNGNLTFTEKAKEFGLADAGYTTHAAFFDYDLDGDLDCYMLNNSFIPVNTLNYANNRDLPAEKWPVADFLKGGGDKLLRNDNGKYTDVSKAAGIYQSLIGFGLGITVGDINGDHYPDLYVSNDFYERDYLYINKQDGTFSEELENRIQHLSMSSMGADLADINNDGHPDIFVTDMLPDDDVRLKTTSSFENYNVHQVKKQRGFYNQYMQNSLQVNNGNGSFTEIAHFAGVAASDWSWGGLIFDADNDGLNDIFVGNGIYQDVTDQDFIDFFANDIIQKMVLTGKKEEVDEVIQKMPSRPLANKLFRNGGNLKFEEIAKAVGLDDATFSNGAAYGDLDGDGDLDLVINNLNQPALVYSNNTVENNGGKSLQLVLRGKAPNTFAIGSTVKVFSGEEVLSREVIPGRGFQSSCDYTVTIGLGNRKPDSLWVIWPNNRLTKLTTWPANGRLYLQMPDTGRQYTPPLVPFVAGLFDTLPLPGITMHEEDDYIDFYQERNIPYMLSREGPAVATGDVNGDGLDDVYLGGAAGKPGTLWLQNKQGKFSPDAQQVFEGFKATEDVCAVFADVNGDKHPDLLVGSGGNHRPAQTLEMQNRLYLNDGKGKFTFSSGSLPENLGNTSVIAPHDMDGDGDIDLFVGTRSYPQQYGMPVRHYLLQNNGQGRFADVTQSMAPELLKTGMVTAATWAQVAGDNKPDLVLAIDWGNPLVMVHEKGTYKPLANLPANMQGWWQAVLATDLDGDGHTDLVWGNMGENYYLKPGKDNPVNFYINDYDGNGLMDNIITRHVGEKDVPVFLKREVTDQVPALKKKNLQHQAFAEQSIEQLFGEKAVAGSKKYTVNQGASVVWWNDGNGSFTSQVLPMQVQWSCVNAVVSDDFNGDGKPDLLLAGNKTSFLPQFSALDGCFGHVLIAGPNRQWRWLSQTETGLQLKKEVRNLSAIVLGGRKVWVAGINSATPLAVGKNILNR